jgi:hypothetical protein
LLHRRVNHRKAVASSGDDLAVGLESDSGSSIAITANVGCHFTITVKALIQATITIVTGHSEIIIAARVQVFKAVSITISPDQNLAISL